MNGKSESEMRNVKSECEKWMWKVKGEMWNCVFINEIMIFQKGG